MTKKKVIELWHKMSDVETQTEHSNIDDVVLKRIRKYCGKKNKRHHKRQKKKKTKHFLKVKRVFLLFKNLHVI